MCSEWGEGNKRLPEKKKKRFSHAEIQLLDPSEDPQSHWMVSQSGSADITLMYMVSWGAADPPFISLSTPEKQGSDKIVFPPAILIPWR